jgi:carbohydrate kinase (thermoresistant glucokinase family)
MSSEPLLVVVMGVAGSGKSTIGKLAAEILRVPFVDADDYHTEANKRLMHEGIALDDAQRGPWLDRLHDVLVSHRASGVVLACSALRAQYRTHLAGDLDVVFELLDVPRDVLEARLEDRPAHFAGPSLLDSQLSTLELSDEVAIVDGDGQPDEVARAVVNAAGRARGSQAPG